MSLRRRDGGAHDNLALGPAAAHRMSLGESSGQACCVGLVVLTDDDEQFVPSKCSGRQMPKHELLVEQCSHRFAAVDQTCCLACAARLSAIDPHTVTFEILRWLDTSDGNRAVKRSLESRGLRASFDTDFKDVILREAQRQLQRGFLIESVPGWCRKHLEWRGERLLRDLGLGTGKSRIYLESFEEQKSATDDGGGLDDLDDSTSDGPCGSTRQVTDLEVSDQHDWDGLDVDDLRSVVLNDVAPAKVRSAALTMVAMVADAARPGAGCPQPGQGAEPLRGPLWAGVWYSGQRELFGPSGTSDERRRKQRSRAIKEVGALLMKVAERVRGAR